MNTTATFTNVQLQAGITVARAMQQQGFTADESREWVVVVTENEPLVDAIISATFTCTCAAVYLGHALHTEGCALATAAV